MGLLFVYTDKYRILTRENKKKKNLKNSLFSFLLSPLNP